MQSEPRWLSSSVNNKDSCVQKPGRKRGKGGDSSDEDSDAEGPSKKKAKKGKKKAAGGESDDDIENVDSDDDALEKILERGMGEEGEGSEDEGGEEGEEGELVPGLSFFSSPNFSGSTLES